MICEQIKLQQHIIQVFYYITFVIHVFRMFIISMDGMDKHSE